MLRHRMRVFVRGHIKDTQPGITIQVVHIAKRELLCGRTPVGVVVQPGHVNVGVRHRAIAIKAVTAMHTPEIIQC